MSSDPPADAMRFLAQAVAHQLATGAKQYDVVAAVRMIEGDERCALRFARAVSAALLESLGKGEP